MGARKVPEVSTEEEIEHKKIPWGLQKTEEMSKPLKKSQRLMEVEMGIMELDELPGIL